MTYHQSFDRLKKLSLPCVAKIDVRETSEIMGRSTGSRSIKRGLVSACIGYRVSSD